MKSFIAFAFATLAVFASAQTISSVVPGNIEEERETVRVERLKREAGFLAEDAACYKKFAVNRCLEEINLRRREVMADLRRRDIELNDEERRVRAAKQIQKSQDKAAPENQQEAANQRAKALANAPSQQVREKEKLDARANLEPKAKNQAHIHAEKLKANQEKVRARAAKQAAVAQEVKKFNDRQQEAQQRRARNASERLKRTKPVGKSLPLPE